VQRKAVLLGERGGAVAAAIVEGVRLAFLYHAAAPGQSYGSQQARLDACTTHWAGGVAQALMLGVAGPLLPYVAQPHACKQCVRLSLITSMASMQHALVVRHCF